MLDTFRENSRSVGTYIVFGILILVFVAYFGPGSQGCTGMGDGASSPTVAATVNGEEISLREFESAYGRLFAMYNQQMGGSFDAKMAEQLGLKNTALDQLVERRLLIAAAKDQGLAVSEDELKKAIKETTAFHKDGRFDFETYKALVQNNLGMSPEKYEEAVRGDLLAQKVMTQVRQGAKASDDEIKAEFEKENNKADLVAIRFSPSSFAGAKPTDAEIQAYLATEEGKKAVEEAYKGQSFRWKQPKRVEAQHILVKVAEDAPEADVTAAQAKLEAAKKRIEGGEDFAAVAKEVSEDPGSKDKGGNLGLFGPGTMAKPFEEAAMALEPGKMSDLVRTRFGFHLIKVNQVQPASEKSLEEAQPQIAGEILSRTKAADAAKAEAQKAMDAAKAGQDLLALYPAPNPDAPETAEKPKAWAEKTGPFALASEYVPKVGVSKPLVTAAAAADKGAVLPEIYEVDGTFVVAVIAERLRPDATMLESKKEDYKKRVLSRKEGELMQSFVKKLRDEAKVDTNPTIFGGGVEAQAAVTP